MRKEGVGMESEKITAAESYLLNLNSDFIAWISIPDTNIDYPVVQSPDDQYYLNHTFEKQENRAGALFTPSAVRFLQDDNTVIFGHNMKDGSMFGQLKKYASKEFCEQYPMILLLYKGREVSCEIFSCSIVMEDEELPYTVSFPSIQDKENFLSRMKLQSLYAIDVTPDPEDKILTLSTCYENEYRFIVQAVIHL